MPNTFSFFFWINCRCLFDDIGDVKITNDGATILKMLEIEHPAAKVDILTFFSLYLYTFVCIRLL